MYCLYERIDNKTNQTTIRYFEEVFFVGNDWEIKILLGMQSCSIIKNACILYKLPNKLETSQGVLNQSFNIRMVDFFI